jgi:hypothetical protein
VYRKYFLKKTGLYVLKISAGDAMQSSVIQLK